MRRIEIVIHTDSHLCDGFAMRWRHSVRSWYDSSAHHSTADTVPVDRRIAAGSDQERRTIDRRDNQEDRGFL